MSHSSIFVNFKQIEHNTLHINLDLLFVTLTMYFSARMENVSILYQYSQTY